MTKYSSSNNGILVMLLDLLLAIQNVHWRVLPRTHFMDPISDQLSLHIFLPNFFATLRDPSLNIDHEQRWF
jgi:hypothetical protein